jgi:hypothetical protein
MQGNTIKMKKPKKKKPRKKSATEARRKALTEWAHKIKDRDVVCCVCGSTTRLNAHHILEKNHYRDLQFDLMVGITLCPLHHMFGKLSAHRNALWWTEWLRANRPDQYQWAMEKINK